MARRGRPKKSLTPIDLEKNELADSIINQVKYNCKLTDEQIYYLQRTLDDTLKGYDLEKNKIRFRRWKIYKRYKCRSFERFFGI